MAAITPLISLWRWQTTTTIPPLRWEISGIKTNDYEIPLKELNRHERRKAEAIRNHG